MTSAFSLVRRRALTEIAAEGSLYKHSSGAELLTLRMPDPSRVFGIAFRTLPEDSTGVPHILEHAVLCGSSRYPLRQPFVELMKGSLQTYLNAMTLPDTTCYPVASPNEVDFRNLMEVYLDAVFAPLLRAETFRQEAWRVEPDEAGRLDLRGVVYNEMKGYFSSPLGALSEAVRRALFPDTVYGVGYGGDVEAIPDLTHAALVAFHRRYYVPANALVFLSAPEELTWELDMLASYLDALSPGEPAATVALQPSFEAPRRIGARYPGPVVTPRRDGFVAMSWALPTGTDRGDRLRWSVLDWLLVGAPAALLRQTLVEGGLGEDLVISGYSDQGTPATFSVGLAGTDPAQTGRVEATVLTALREAAGGLDPADVEAALNTVEFRLREGSTGAVPPGIRHMMTALGQWRHGGDPFEALGFDKELGELRDRLAAGETGLENMIAQLIDSPHRVTVMLEADPDLGSQNAEVELHRIARLAVGADVDGLAQEAGALAEFRERPETPEALASVPLLRLSDLPRTVPLDAVEVRPAAQHVWLVQPLATQGIVHIDLGIDLAGLPAAQASAAQFLCAALLVTGTEQYDHVALARRIGTATGGINAVPWAASMREGGTASRMFLRGKALAAQARDLCAILEGVLLTARLDDTTRLREVVLREKARAEARLVPAGHETVDLRLRAGLSEAGMLMEATAGASYLRFLQDAVVRMAESPEAFAADLIALRERLLRRGAVCSVTADPATQAVAEPFVTGLLAALDLPARSWSRAPDGVGHLPSAEALEVSTQVNFVGLGGDLYDAGLARTGAAEAAARHLANTWLWDRVRVQGGAYGALCRFDLLGGIVTMLSYRDPHVVETVETFRAAAAHLSIAPSSRDLTAAVVATVGAQDRPLPPGACGFAALQRWLAGETEVSRNQRREELLGASASNFAAFGAGLEAMSERVVVLGGAQALDTVEETRPGWLNRTRLL